MKLSNRDIAVCILGVLVFAHWILITPQFITEKKFKQEFGNELQHHLAYYPYTINAKGLIYADGFMVNDPLEEQGHVAGLASDKGDPYLLLARGNTRMILKTTDESSFLRSELGPNQLCHLDTSEVK